MYEESPLSTILVWILIINTALALLYFVVNLIRRKPVAMTLLFIAMPVVGFILYFVPIFLRRFIDARGVNREAVLTHAFDIERKPEHPDVEESLNVVPIEDAMVISDDSEKRALLLHQLQKSLQDNYRSLLVASEDEDSESAHYVAAAKMEIYRLHQAHWLERRRDFEEEPTPETFHAAFDALDDMIKSGVLSKREQNSYQKRMCELVQKELNSNEATVTTRELEEYLRALVDLGSYDQAKHLWNKYSLKLRSEDSYQSMMKMYYQMGNYQEFEAILDDLRKNRQVRLSPNGLEQLRYWMVRLEDNQTG